MKTSPNGIQFIESNEGFRASVYKDITGKRTIGFGHLMLPTDTYTTITQAEAETILYSDVEHVEIYLNATFPGLHQNEFDALVDFGFNLGTGPLHQLLSHGMYNIHSQILLWDHAGGVVVEGLRLRRLREQALWDLDNHEGV